MSGKALKDVSWELIMSVRKLLFFFFACALMVPMSSAAQAKRSAADQQLYEKARKACSGPQYPSGARPHINYAGKWFRCVGPRIRER
jgi:hypothetical protein